MHTKRIPACPLPIKTLKKRGEKTRGFSRGKEDNGSEHKAIPWQEICQIKSRARSEERRVGKEC